MIGERLKVPGTEASLGGKGSGAEIAVSGVAHGLKTAEFRISRGRWVLEEIAQGQVRLNGRRPGRRNTLKSGDAIAVPGILPKEPIRLEVEIERDKNRSLLPVSLNLGKVNPQYVVVGIVYGLMFIFAAIYLRGGDEGRSTAQRAEIGAILWAEIEAAGPAANSEWILFDPTPQSFRDLRVVMASSLPEAERDAMAAKFVLTVEQRFAKARRLADIGLEEEAIEEYDLIIDLMDDDAELRTTQEALRERHAVSNAGGRP
ncbi:hypothetical protein FEV53_12835 [Palleronia caenipelagi]|uniref:FHA domain-containing protein n=2 Tax=Palleronia caenipelagi TaxID=2489174 RepID=A0A547PUE3_9RHOB|nr:hypothetical protein FEV53_12835 [Palleronia caenipelagi]